MNPEHSQKTILVADDEKHILRLLEYNLEQTGCKIETAGDGKEALAKATGTHIDMLIIDVMMPGLNGLQVVAELRSLPQYKTLPVVMLTGLGQNAVRAEAREMGVTVFLTKPFSPIQLLGYANEYLGLKEATAAG